jgi:predicted Zn-dependent protease
MNQEGVSELEKKAVLDGAAELLKIAGIAELITIKDWGVWRADDWLNPDSSLKRNQSVEWYLEKGKGKNNNSRQLLTDLILCELKMEPLRKKQDHYDILICLPDLNTPYLNTEYIVGQGRDGVGTVLSTFRFRNRGLNSRELRECIKTVTMHELGHAFGLPGNGPNVYLADPDDIRFGHCMNRCVMRQGESAPHDFVRMSNDRLRYGALCGDCRRELRDYFKE